MKKANNTSKTFDDDMLPEYDFKGQKGARGKYYLGPKQAHSVHVRHADGTITRQSFDSLQKVILLDADVAARFPDSESVNRALRTLISLVPEKQVGEKKADYRTSKPARRKTTGRR